MNTDKLILYGIIAAGAVIILPKLFQPKPEPTSQYSLINLEVLS